MENPPDDWEGRLPPMITLFLLSGSRFSSVPAMRCLNKKWNRVRLVSRYSNRYGGNTLQIQ